MSSEQAKLYHSITFGDKNTWDDWNLVPSTRPVIAPPKVKTNYLEIPGADGSLDISDGFRGFPVYQNREGSIEFYVLRDKHYKWSDVYSTVMNYIHGKKMTMILDDDPYYYYEGRFSVSNWASDPDYSKITIDYNVSPYKQYITTSIDDWIWDTFNFNEDIIGKTIFSDISVDSDDYVYLDISSKHFDIQPVCPIFHVTGDDIWATFINNYSEETWTGDLPSGISQPLDIIIYGGEGCRIGFKGHGTVSIEFRNGRL